MSIDRRLREGFERSARRSSRRIRAALERVTVRARRHVRVRRAASTAVVTLVVVGAVFAGPSALDAIRGRGELEPLQEPTPALPVPDEVAITGTYSTTLGDDDPDVRRNQMDGDWGITSGPMGFSRFPRRGRSRRAVRDTASRFRAIISAPTCSAPMCATTSCPAGTAGNGRGIDSRSRCSTRRVLPGQPSSRRVLMCPRRRRKGSQPLPSVSGQMKGGTVGGKSWSGSLAAVALILLSCTGDGSDGDESFRPRFEEMACPSDVEDPGAPGAFMWLPHRLGGPRGRWGADHPGVRAEGAPPSGRAPRGSVFVLGGNIGEASEDRRQHTVASPNRIAYVVDPRGTGHSRPKLACPEVDALDDDVAKALASDDDVREEFAAAVKACHDRLASQGVNVAAYDIEQAAADVEDLRRALGIAAWNLGSLGTQSRCLLEVMRSYPEQVRSVYMDSPEFPQLPDPEAAVIGTHWALQQLADACASVPRCRHEVPDTTRALSRATSRLDAQPGTFVSRDGAIATSLGRPVRIRVDGGKLLRVVRSSLGLTQWIPSLPL